GAPAVDLELRAAQDLEVEPGGAHHEIGTKLPAGAQLDAGLGECLDLVRHDRGPALADRMEEITVRSEAEALVPGIVARREMGGDVVLGSELGAQPIQDHSPGTLRVPLADAIEVHAGEHILPSRE